MVRPVWLRATSPAPMIMLKQMSRTVIHMVDGADRRINLDFFTGIDHVRDKCGCPRLRTSRISVPDLRQEKIDE